MSQESHHLHHHHHHHHPLHEFSTIARNNSSINNFELAGGGHDPFTMDWRGLGHQTDPVSWPGESSLTRPLHTNQVQSLSLSLFNHPQPHSFQGSSHLPLQIRSNNYLLPAQELLDEFCSLGGGNNIERKSKDESISSWSQQTLYNMEPLELQRRKAKLLTMLGEVDRRYRRYSEQMKAVVSAFEEAAGKGAGRTYSMLAWKAMSRHFRCLRDGISVQIIATTKAMGEKDGGITLGFTRGETPRLRLLDQCLRQQKAFQHPGIMECHPWKPQRGLPERSVSTLRAWLFEHFLHPYPSDVDKHNLARQTGLSRSQVSNWFINARVRLWKPMVEEIYLEELKEEEEKKTHSSYATSMQDGGSNSQPSSNPNPSSYSQPHFDQDRKREPDNLQHIDEPHSLSSIISSMNSHRHHNPNPNQSFGILEEDHFGSYHGQELTLGLQHHESDAMQFSILVGEGQNIPNYRNLMGTQLLHDLAG